MGLRPLRVPGLRRSTGVEGQASSQPLTSSEGKPAYRIWESHLAFLLTLLALTLLTPRIMTYLTPVTGDEPFYLMTAISIWDDHDLNECNNYRQRDESRLYPPFYTSRAGGFGGFPRGWQGWRSPYPLPPHPAQLVPYTRMCAGLSEYEAIDPRVALPDDGSGNELYSKHGLGLSLMILPAFVLGDRPFVVLLLNLVGALLAANVYLLAREGTGKVLPAILTWAAFTFTVPQLTYSFLIFPELPAALFVLYAFRRIRLWHNNVWQVAAIGFSMAFLPWLHYRFIPVSVGLFAYYVYQDFAHRRKARLVGEAAREAASEGDHASVGLANEPPGGQLPRPTWRRNSNLNYILIAGQPVVSAVLLMLFFYHRYEQIIPNSADHAGSSDLAGTLRGMAGLLLDEQWGLLVAAPIFILAIVGVLIMGAQRAWRKDLVWIGVIFVPYYLVVANYAQWWGEWCPPARYVASTLPLLALPFAVSLSRIGGGAYKGIYLGLLLLSLFTTWAFIHQPQWLYNQPYTYRTQEQKLLPTTSQVITRGVPDLLREVAPDLPAKKIATGISDNIPSFVFTYFASVYMYPEEAEPVIAAAWYESVPLVVAILLIIAISLALALASQRRRPASAQPLPAGPSIDSQEYTTERAIPQATEAES